MSQSTGDSQLITAVVQSLKSRGIFDEFRRECLSDADTKPSFQNLLQRVEGYVSKFLSQQKWNQNINKNQLRERMRTQINESGMLKYGIEHLVEQVVNYKINSLFWPKIESVVKEFLGIQETPVICLNPPNPLLQKRDNFSKSFSKKSSKIDENIEIKTINIKVEPKEEKISEESTQTMDIENDSNCSLIQNKTPKEENESLGVGDSADGYVDWPTPPQPEMLTPERPQLTYSPIDTKECNKSSDDSNSAPNVKTEENSLDNEIKENETFLINKETVNRIKVEIKSEPIVEKNRRDCKEKDNDLSDVSSVHTSDLSDFDDEISLDDSDEEREDNKKKKISLKVVKKITEVLSNEQIGERNTKKESKVQKQSSFDEQNSSNLESKRIRRLNPKYSSEEFSSIFTEKDRSLPGVSKEESTENDQKLSSRRRRHSNSSDNDNKEINEMNCSRSSKAVKREEIGFDSRCSSRASLESSLSETTQDSTQSQSRSQKRKNRNESQTQRYEASDLYKPRPVISSRRTRAPDSSTQSNEDFFIHDLSK